jgi:EpsI family protein
MGDVAATRPAAGIRREQLWIAAAIGIAIYIFMDQVDGFIALPMREISSRASAFILNALSIKTVRTGTILATDNFTFDVVPACSGSTTLRVLLTLGAIWCAIHPHLTFGRRIFCGVMVIPISLFANGVRVAALVGLGDVLLKPVDGAPHALIGLFGFALAMSTLYLLTELLATGDDAAKAPVKFPFKLFLLGFAMVVLYTPVLIWMMNAWVSGPLELVGILYVAAAAGVIIFFWRRWPGNSPGGRWACAAFGLSILAFAAATLLDVRTVEASCLLASLFALLWLFKGIRFAFCAVPLLLVVELAFPTISTAVAGLTSRILGLERPAFALLARSAAAALLVGVSALLFVRQSFPGPWRPRSPLVVNIAIFLAVLGVLFQTHFNSQAASFDQEGQLQLSYVQGDWIGLDTQISEVALDQIGRDRIISRRYVNKDRMVDVIVTTTGADRRRAHPPEWCMTGVGWTVQSRDLTRKRLRQHDVPMTRMIFRRGDGELEFYYWFSDGEKHYATHNEMMREDLVRRLKGIRTNWMLLRIIAPRNNTYLDDFMSGLEPSVARLVVNRPV